jgi:hypothetical protein
MPEASAYPNSDISIGAMTAIAVVMIAVLAFWLIMVYVAAREPRTPPARGQQPAADGQAEVAAPDDVTEDRHVSITSRG